mmetsp:Transcript_813/g.690  ORF Transcript_813/g.690 Transcript_813/m.690 type:complete len:90 (-) Transcript_813:30-299(-)
MVDPSSMNVRNLDSHILIQKRQNKMFNHHESLKPPKIGLRIPTPDKLDKFDSSDNDDIEFEQDMLDKELASERIQLPMDYFKLEDEKII